MTQKCRILRILQVPMCLIRKIPVKVTNTFVLFIVVMLYACIQDNKPEYKSIPESIMKQAKLITIPVSQLVSPKDTICGMDLKGGIGDTILINGSILGFCSTVCKQIFIQKKMHL